MCCCDHALLNALQARWRIAQDIFSITSCRLKKFGQWLMLQECVLATAATTKGHEAPAQQTKQPDTVDREI
jgi:hypothetical protein